LTYLSSNLRLRVDHVLLRHAIIRADALIGDARSRVADRRQARGSEGAVDNYLMDCNLAPESRP